MPRFLSSRMVRRVALGIAVLAVLVVVIASLDLPPIARTNVVILSGVEDGNYHAIVRQLAAAARMKGGLIVNVPTFGSVDNIQRLTAARESCRADFALVQEGPAWPAGLELVARLPRSESVFFLGREADRIRTLADLRGFRIGIGPEGSGTAMLSRQILESPALLSLGLTLTTHPFKQQFSLLETGALDLGVIVMDEDALMVEDAVRVRGLAMLSLPLADVIARRLPHVRTGRVGAGQYDPVRVLPPTDKTVLHVDTLLVGNGCASRSATTGLLTLMAGQWPDFLRRNQDTANTTGLLLTTPSRAFFERGGPDLATEHASWAVDIMPLSNWIYVIAAVSILFTFIGTWSRFRLWRIDARRVQAEERLPGLFRPGITAREIGDLRPMPEHLTLGHRAMVADLIAIFEALSTRCRQQSLSVVSDMGQELPYRYQEHLIADWLVALRRFRARVDALMDAGVSWLAD